MVDPVAVWHAEHLRFASLLDFIEQQMGAFHDGKDPDYELMHDVVYYLHHYADRYHHPREDAAFARLTKRDPGLSVAINRLLEEHRELEAAGGTLLKYLDDILEDRVIRRSTVEAAAAAVPEIPDPLFGDDVAERYRELRKWIKSRAASGS